MPLNTILLELDLSVLPFKVAFHETPFGTPDSVNVTVTLGGGPPPPPPPPPPEVVDVVVVVVVELLVVDVAEEEVV
jgi:hypothetical protein